MTNQYAILTFKYKLQAISYKHLELNQKYSKNESFGFKFKSQLIGHYSQSLGFIFKSLECINPKGTTT